MNVETHSNMMIGNRLTSGGTMRSVLKVGSGQQVRNSNEDIRDIGGQQEKKKVNVNKDDPNGGADYFKDVIHEIKREERKFKRATM